MSDLRMRLLMAAICLFLQGACAASVTRPSTPPQAVKLDRAESYPRHTTQVPDPPETQVARDLLVDLSQGKLEAARQRFNSTMATRVGGTKLAALVSTIGGQDNVRLELATVEHHPPRTHVWYKWTSSKGPWEIEVVVDESLRVSGLAVLPASTPWTTPDYANPNLFGEQHVDLGSPPLSGVLSIPSIPSSSIVVLIHGSGAQDEDASTGRAGHGRKAFRDLAWGLASRGIAVLRYPKRTWAYPELYEGKAYTFDDEVISDACLALKTASRSVRANPHRVFLLGHSLGAALAPRIASQCPVVDGMVLLAGPSRSIQNVALDQFQYFASAGGLSRDQIESRWNEILGGFLMADIPAASGEEVLSFFGVSAPRSYWQDLADYSVPRAVSRMPSIPLLVLQGGRDYQVGIQDFDGWKKLLRGRPGASFLFYPSLDHWFVAGSGPSLPAHYARADHIAPEVIEDIASWIHRASP